MKHYSLLLTIVCFALLGGCSSDFVNPGGMWMPHQLAEQADTLRSLGVDNPEALCDPLAEPLGAIVWLGGCSASFVSPDGLIVTNHHCANSTLQSNSTPGCNLLEDGFLARSRDEEKPGEIGKKVWITQDIREITDLMTDGLSAIADPIARHDELEKRIKTIIADHEDLPGGIRCSVKSYFGGQQYYLITQLELRDIRLVYAPCRGIGWYGGNVDNWQWPRHTGDFTFLRAYVGPDGKSAIYSKENVPYRPKHYLRLASEPLGEGDFVMVAGYPGRTQRWKTAGQARFAYESANPKRIEILSDVAKVYDKLAAQSEELSIKATPSIKGVMNYLKLLQLVQKNIETGDVIAEKQRREDAFVQWLNADAERKAKWAPALEEMNGLIAEAQRDDYPDYLTECLTRYVGLVNAAHTIVRMAEERPIPDAEREPEFQERNWDRLIAGRQRMQVSYDRKIDRAILRFYLSKINRLPDAQKQPVLSAVYDSDDPQNWNMRKRLRTLFTKKLTLEDVEVRIDLLQNASLDDLRASSDPMIQLALRLRPLTKTLENKYKTFDGKMIVLRPKYVEAMKTFLNGQAAPDANGTLRVTYGTVRGYRPAADATMYEPFTTLSQLTDKHTGTPPFDAPEELLDAAKDVQGSSFFMPEIGDVPVNFLADLDITGGNSGSATLNRNGELVGLVFDGNAESLASNWLFDPEITRSIHVDLRYILWVMQNVDHADNLLEELGID